MRIAIFTELFWPYILGGGENRYYEIAKRLARKHEVHVYTMKLKGTKNYEIHENIHIHRLGIFKHPLDKRSLKPLVFYFLHSLIKPLPNVDIIDCNTYFPCISGFIRSKIRKKPIVATIHDVYRGMWGFALGNKFLNPVGNFIELLVCKLPYNKIITVSSSTKNLLMKTFSISNKMIEIIPNGIGIKTIDKIKAKKKKNQICYVGRLNPHKHIEDLIEVVEKLKSKIPDIKCKIVGGGVLRNKLERDIRRRGLSKQIEFCGFMKDYKNVIKIMKESEVFILPSTREGFGIVMIEAMRCMAVPVAYKLDAYKDFCNNKNSVLVKERDVNELYKKVEVLLINPKVRNDYAKNGFRTSAKFDWDRITKSIEELYEENIHYS